jgi:hypothetical protein
VKESVICLFNENTTPDTDSTETELTLLKFRLDQNQPCSHTRSRSQSRRTLVVSWHWFSSSDRRWPHTTTLFDANRSQSWAALSGLTEEKDAIFLLVSYRPFHIIFLRNWSIKASLVSCTRCKTNKNKVLRMYFPHTNQDCQITALHIKAPSCQHHY